jgi:tetratricopeptide (TPR) repeat protein
MGWMLSRDTAIHFGRNQIPQLKYLLALAFALVLVCPLTVNGATGTDINSTPCVAGQPAKQTIEGCTKLLSLPDTASSERINLFVIRGNAYYSMQEFALAVADFKSAQAIHDAPNVAVSIAVSEFALGNNTEAVTELSKVIDAGIATAQVFSLRGMAYQNAGNFDASIADFNRVLILNPNSLEALNNRAAAYGKKGDYENAIKDLNSVLVVNPKMAMALVNRCALFAREGNFEKGQRDCDDAEKLSPDNYLVLLSIGAAYYFAKHYEDAIGYYNKSLQLMPHSPATLYSRGVAQSKLGKEEESKTDLLEATRLAPNIATIMDNAGMK